VVARAGRRTPTTGEAYDCSPTVDEADRIHAVRRLAPHGLKAWAQVLERGYEGLVAKDDASPYVGGQTRDWLKVKQAKIAVRSAMTRVNVIRSPLTSGRKSLSASSEGMTVSALVENR